MYTVKSTFSDFNEDDIKAMFGYVPGALDVSRLSTFHDTRSLQYPLAGRSDNNDFVLVRR